MLFSEDLRGPLELFRMGKFNKPNIKFCACGCGRIPNAGKKYIHGHNGRDRSAESLQRITDHIKQRSQNPAYREKLKQIARNNASITSERSKAQWERKGFREFRSKIMQEKQVYKKISKKLKNNWEDPDFIANHSGKGASNWQGGKSFINYPKEWDKKLIEKIRARDHYRCQKCGISQSMLGRALHIHHIDYNKHNCDPSNLISLCARCHAQSNVNNFDRYYMTIMYRNILEYGVDPNLYLTEEDILNKYPQSNAAEVIRFHLEIAQKGINFFKNQLRRRN